jgi:hypothetical protein
VHGFDGITNELLKLSLTGVHYLYLLVKSAVVWRLSSPMEDGERCDATKDMQTGISS